MQGKRDVFTRTHRAERAGGLLIQANRRSVATTPTGTTGEEATMATAGTDLTHAAAALVDAFDRADWDTWRSLITDDAVYTETGTGRRVEGADAYLELCQSWKAALPDVAGTIRHAVASGDTVAQEIHWEGTHTGPLPTPDGVIEPTGKRIAIDASLWIRYAGDQAQEVHHYLDVLMLLQQLGAIPAPAQ
jgi:steroid delta-isomerase-like uncharacterized protein